MEIYKNTVKRMPNRSLITWITIQSIRNFGPTTTGEFTDKIITGDGVWNFFDRTTPSYTKAAMLGGPVGISCDLTKLTEEVLQLLEEQIAQFKQERGFWGNSECHILEDTEAITVLQYNDPDFTKVKLQVFVKKVFQNAVTVYPICANGATYALEDGTVLNSELLSEEGLELATRSRNSAVCIELVKQ